MQTHWFGRYLFLRIFFVIMYSRISSTQSDEDGVILNIELDVDDGDNYGLAAAQVKEGSKEILPKTSNEPNAGSVEEGKGNLIGAPNDNAAQNGKDNEHLHLQLKKHKQKMKLEQNINLNLEIHSEIGFNYTADEMEKLKIWPKGVIPYFIDDFSFDYNMREKIRKILGSFNQVTGLHFTELPTPPNDDNERWVLLVNRRGILGCEDYNTNSFTITGVQRVVLGYDCLGADANGAALAPTILALAGVPPQHNSPDRDQYIQVNIDTIIPEKRDLLKKLNNNEWLFHDIEYDYLSAGHYDSHKFTINGSATIVPLGKFKHFSDVGQGDGISLKDIWKIKMLYNYISLDRHKAKLNDCSRIFKLGNAFQSIRPTESSIIPRDKPSKYSSHRTNENNNVIANNAVSDNEHQGEIVDTVSDSDPNIALKKKKPPKKLKSRANSKSKQKLKQFLATDFDTDRQ